MILLKSFLVGFIIAIPTGPVGVLCARRALLEGWRAGLISALGSVSADLLYIVIVLLGLHNFSHVLLEHREPLRLIGGLFVVGLGIITLFSSPATPTAAPRTSFHAYFWSTFLLTLTNPIFLATFTALLVAYGLTIHHVAEARIIAAGVFAGSTAWWLLFTGLAQIIRRRMSDSFLSRINRISGALIIALGIVALAVFK